MSDYTIDQLRMLLTLQDLDSRIDAAQAALQRATEGVSLRPLRDAVASAQTASDQLGDQLATMRRDLRYQEQEAEALRDEIDAQEKRLYGGAVRNPKEAAQMQQHVASLRRRLTELDNRAVEMMLAVEEFEPQVTEAIANLTTCEADLALAEQSVAEEVAKLNRELPELIAERDAVAGRVPPALLKEYRTLRVRRAGIAVAALVDGRCSRCRMTIPYIMTREIRGGMLRTCDTCGRIVVEPE